MYRANGQGGGGGRGGSWGGNAARDGHLRRARVYTPPTEKTCPCLTLTMSEKAFALGGSATNKATSDASSGHSGLSFKEKAPALIERYRVSWETVVCNLTPQIKCLLENDAVLASQLLAWEGKTKVRMQELVNAHVDKFCK
jgi:hypothetical protein